MPVALRLPRLAPQHLLELAAAEWRQCHPENDRILREASALHAPGTAPLLPSNRAIRLSRSDTIDRERCLPALREYAALLQARGNVPSATRGVIPEFCAARKVRLENSAANRVLHSQQRCVEQDKAREPSAPKPPASSQPIISFGNSPCRVCLPRLKSSREIDVQCGAAL